MNSSPNEVSQLSLRFNPEPEENRKLTVQERFLRYHAANPQVYEALCEMARKCRAFRRDRVIGIQMLFEVLRWNYYTSVDSEEDFKFPNAFAAGYARIIMRQEPDLEGCFRLAKSDFDSGI